MGEPGLRQSALLVVALLACRQWKLDRACAEAGRQYWNRQPKSDLDYRTRAMKSPGAHKWSVQPSAHLFLGRVTVSLRRSIWARIEA